MFSYDAKGNLIDIITQKALSTYKQTYQYDKTGNRTSYTEPNATHTYTYDPTYQLVSADHPNITDENYTYDPVGNRLTTTVDNANRLTEDQNHTYQYDNNGNLIRKTHKITGIITRYTYDYENRLIKINLPLGITAEYKYDPFGRRIEKNISGQITVQYLYDNEDIIMEYAAIIPTNTNITTKYIHGPNIDEPLSMLRNNKTYYYHADALGSITRMTDQNGNIVQTIRYDSFGNIKSISNPLLIQPYAWTGREYDIESGFYYLRNRYYDPKTGRFITKDPIGFAGGDVNLFRYVGNGPVNWVDPWGYFKLPPSPSGLPPGWIPDPTDPRGRTYINPNDPGRKLRFDPAQPDSINPNKQTDHWHDDIPGQKAKEGRKHRLPSEEVPNAPPPFNPPILRVPIPIFLIPVYCASPGANEAICGRCPNL